MEGSKRGYIVDPDRLQRFFQAMRNERVQPVVDAPGRFASRGFHTSAENLIRTLDLDGMKYLIAHPNLNNAAIRGQPWAYEEFYMHGVHDLGAVVLGFHTSGHPHQGLATGFHAADLWFNRLIGRTGENQLRRFNETKTREFGISR